MLEIFRVIIANTPNFIPILLTVGVIWVLIGWFYAEVLGREIHDFIVFSIMIVIALLAIFIFVNKDIQLLFFGSY